MMMRRILSAVSLLLVAAAALAFTHGSYSIVLNSNTAAYSDPGSYYVVRDNLSSGTLVRGVDFEETLTVYPGLSPDNTLIAWSWPAASWPQAPSYPEAAYGNLHPQNLSPPAKQVKNFTTLTERLSYTEGGPNYTYGPLTEMWLSPDAAWTTSSFEVELILDQALRNESPFFLPINHQMTSPFGADVFVVPNRATPTSQVLIFPTLAYGSNTITDTTLSGSVNGTPGTDPTNSDFTSANSLGLTKSIIGSGTATASDGTTVNCVSVRYNGTTTATSNIVAWLLSSANLQSVGTTRSWTEKVYLAVVGGSTANFSLIAVQMNGFDSGFNYLGQGGGGNIASALTSTPQPFGASHVWGNPSVVWTQPGVYLGSSSGLAVDITLQICTPFFGTGGFATLNDTTVDWKAIYADLIAANVITGNEYAHGLEIGPEVYSGSGSFTINAFNVTWE